MSTVRIATRGSDLALAQARGVAARIEAALGVSTELVVVRTRGDRRTDVPLWKIGGKALFVKEIEQALAERRADVAVHSAKDLPAGVAEGMALVAWPEREDPRDALVTREPGGSLAALPPGSKVGTGSLRRGALLRAARPDLEVHPLRGNVPTRIGRLEEGLDAVVLACAGMERLGLKERIDERLSPDVMLPAVGQGTLSLETRAGEALSEDLRALDDPDTALAARAERAFLARLEGDCTVPIAAHATRREDGLWRVRGLVALVDGTRIARAERDGVADSGLEAAGLAVAEEVLASGGDAILAAMRESPPS